MMNTTYNLVLDHLRAIRADVASIKSDSRDKGADDCARDRCRGLRSF